jgi:LuxR family maltose regulon positive regulatory protein
VGARYFQAILEKLEHVTNESPSDLSFSEAPWRPVEIFALGVAEVRQAGKPIEKGAWQTATTKELFFYFALNRQAWRKEQITTALWHDMPRGQANDLFHSSIYRLRRALFPEAIVYHNGMYELNPEMDWWIDADEFERQLAEAEQIDAPSEAAPLVARALTLYRGDLLEEVYGDWCVPRRDTLRAKYLAAMTRLAEFHARAREFDKAVALYQAILTKDNAREETYRALIELFAQMGDRARAAQMYQQCVKALAEELGVAPADETVALYQRIAQAR